jgi:hypothetical protein
VLFSTFGPDGFQRRSNGPGANLGTHSPRSYGAVPDPNKIPKWIASSKLRKSCGGHSGTHNLGPAIDFFQIFLTIVASQVPGTISKPRRYGTLGTKGCSRGRPH